MIRLLLSAFSEYPKLDTGGANKIILQILQHLDRNSFCAAYHSCHFSKKFSNQSQITHQIYASLKFKKKIGSNLFLKNHFIRGILSSPFYLNRYLRKCNEIFENLLSMSDYDVLHSHDIRTIYYLQKFNFRKKILTIHSKGSLLNDLRYYSGSISTDLLYKYSKMENESLIISDLITFPSMAAKYLFLNEKNIPVEENKIRIVYNGVDLDYINSIFPDEDFRKKYSIPSGYDFILINIADHIRVKNIDIALKIVEYLNRAHKVRALLINAGHGPETVNLKRLSYQLKISDRVIFLGRLPYDEIIKLIKVGDFLISTADKVVFDLAILEALASGVLVIASDCGGNKEVIKNNINGFLIKDFQVEEYGNVIINSDVKIRMNISESVKNFSVQKMVDGYQDLYEL
ncbi:MAG: glycosyltransferase family 4 protein [Ignavibacteriaceae bacterium]|nr:glycosyltransferase family 4 protein [Ignavibacteriaceae bacterium]